VLCPIPSITGLYRRKEGIVMPSVNKETEASWRGLEPSLREVTQKYPDVSPFAILKIDIQRRGAKLTPRAREAIGRYVKASSLPGANR
jgi:hypothetical protein